MPIASLPGRDARRSFLLVAALVASLFSASSASAMFDFGNPKDGSFHSGASMFAGWHCTAQEVTLEVDGGKDAGGTTIEAATRTEFGSTEPFCGDTNNGWGALWNFNLFGEGEHTVIAKADGVPFGPEVTFTVVKPTEQNFNRDISGAYTLPSFPGAGEAVDVIFQTGTQNFDIAPAGSVAGAASFPTAADAVSNPAVETLFTFENPANAAFVSGVIIFSGWICDADEVRIRIDDSIDLFPGYGTARGDTQGVCGDADNGFGLLWNVNQFGSGAHTADLYIDDELAETHSFWVTKPSDQNFNRDLDGFEYRLPGFPNALEDTTIVFQTEDQNFGIKSVTPTAGATPVPPPGSTPTPGITPTPSPEPGATPTPNGGATPTPNGGGTPTPNGGPVCGNGIVEGDEQCDGEDLGELAGETGQEACFLLFGGFNLEAGPECQEGSSVGCTNDCQFDGTLCSCLCLEDFDCTLPEGQSIECAPYYCNEDFCEAADVPDCECSFHGDDFDGICLGSNYDNDVQGFCAVTPFDAGDNDSNLINLCTGFDGGDFDFPRCDYCE